MDKDKHSAEHEAAIKAVADESQYVRAFELYGPLPGDDWPDFTYAIVQLGERHWALEISAQGEEPALLTGFLTRQEASGWYDLFQRTYLNFGIQD